MTGRTTLLTALLFALIAAQSLVGADTALEKTIERAKEKRTEEIAKASDVYYRTVERADTALTKALELAISTAKKRKDDSRAEQLSAVLEGLKAGSFDEKAAMAAADGNPLSGVILRRNTDHVSAEAAFKKAVERANTSLEAAVKPAIAAYKRKSDPRADELTTELAAIKAEAVSPAKSEAVAAESKGGNGHQELIKTVGDTLFTADNKKVPSKALGGAEYVLVYFSASWCGPCRAFTPELVKFHNDYSKKAKFEVLLVGSDRSEQDMLNYMSGDKMPWLGVPFGSNGANALQVKHNVRGIPALVAYDKEGNVISTPGAGAGQVLAEFKQKLGVR